MERIIEYTKDKDFEAFRNDQMLRDAVIRNFEIIGESVRHIPFSFQRRHSELPWKNMYALRNFIVHEFFDIDDEIIWSITQQDLWNNLQDIRRLLKHVPK
jgi:uncharacterized protein with HEPN domain